MKAVLLVVILAAVPAAAQHHGYHGQPSREIKALSADEVKQYLAGAGMGYAKAAELNHFPGPQHALEALFRAGNAEEQVLAQAVRAAAALEGEYRLSHLETHRRMRSLLTHDQVARYDELRGYRP